MFSIIIGLDWSGLFNKKMLLTFLHVILTISFLINSFNEGSKAQQDHGTKMKGRLITSLHPLRIHSSHSRPPRPPTLRECEVIIRQLYNANSLQSQEVSAYHNTFPAKSGEMLNKKRYLRIFVFTIFIFCIYKLDNLSCRLFV